MAINFITIMDFASIDLLWAVLGGMLILLGIVGCFLPVIPGPPFGYAGLLLLQLWAAPPFTTKFLLIWLAIVVVVTALDYVVPVYGTKKFGGSKMGVYGSTLGLIIGLAFGPIGIILGPMIGATIGELIAGKNHKEAVKAGLGSFLGFLVGTMMKLMVASIMGYYFFKAVIVGG